MSTEIKVFENGRPDDAADIREEVFIKEQGFEKEFDDIDNTSIHFVAYNGKEAIGTCRVFKDDDKEKSYILGRLAVVKSERKNHIGSKLIEAVEKYIIENGENELKLHAQCQAAGFYEKSGFSKYGEIGLDEGCPHIWMKKVLV